MAGTERPRAGDVEEEAPLPDDERDRRIADLVLVRAPLSPDQATLLRGVFDEILDAHMSGVWGYLRRNLEATEAEDVLQDVLLSFYQQLLDRGFPDRIPSELFSLARGKISNLRRGVRREPFSVGLPSSGSEPPRTPRDMIRQVDLDDLREKLLPRLPQEQRELIELVELEGLTHAEAGAALGIPVGTVKSRLTVAKKRLADLADEILPPSERAA